jgi:hypothetical protein
MGESLSSRVIDERFAVLLKQYSADSDDLAIVNALSLSTLNADLCKHCLMLALKVSTISQSTEYEIATLMADIESVFAQVRSAQVAGAKGGANSQSGQNVSERAYSALLLSSQQLAKTVSLIVRVQIFDNKSNEFKLLPSVFDELILKNQLVSREFGLQDNIRSILLG